MLVSHDRALLRSVCDEFWLVARSGLVSFDGDLDDYQRFLLDEAKRVREESKVALKEEKATVEPASPSSLNKKITPQMKALKRDLGKVEQRMAELETRRADLEASLGGDLDPQAIGEIGLELQSVNEALADCEEQWLSLSEQIEA